MAYFWVAIGGAIGSVLRFALSSVFARWLGQAFLGTTVVNITGSFVIGVIAALGPLAVWEQLLMIGVCGGYTTFSSFSLQTLELLQQGRWPVALWNAGASVIFCVLAVWLGHTCGSMLKR